MRAHRMHSESRMLNKMKNVMSSIGEDTGDFASRFGSNTADFARRIGPGRTIAGLAVLGAIVGTSFLIIRYLRARRDELPYESDVEERGSSIWSREDRRAARREARNAY